MCEGISEEGYQGIIDGVNLSPMESAYLRKLFGLPYDEKVISSFENQDRAFQRRLAWNALLKIHMM